MIDLVLIIGIIVGAFHFGWTAREIWAKHQVKKIHQEIEDNLFQAQEQIKDNIIPMRVEKHNNEYYLYNTINQSFICQGKTKDDLFDKFSIAYPKKKGVIFEGGELWREVNDK